jgi:DNA-directed RNA polymerase specialized sigma24 family protein
MPSKPELPPDGMTPEELKALLDRLAPDPELAGARYVEIRERLVRLLQWRGCEDPEVLADEAINRVARKLARNIDIKAEDPFNYFYGVAHLLHKEAVRKQNRQWRALQEYAAIPVKPEQDQEDRQLGCLQRCLDRWPEEQRQFLLRYHGEDDRIRGRQALADELGIGLNALRIRAHRLRRELENCVRLCLERPR